MSTSRMVSLAGLSRATYYRLDPEKSSAVQDVELRDEIQRIALKHPSYGRPRITAELKRRGWERVNHKRVGRILHEDNLLCIRKKKFHSTTDSKHGFQVYPNLIRKLVPTRRNQVWVADITYIRLSEEFVYLAVVLDAYSRMVIGWSLERTLEAKLAVGALQMAIDKRGTPAGLIHHSDRGVQYACGDYTKLLGDHKIQISMSAKGNPYDNAKAESFMKTLKHEEVYRVEYRDMAEARRGIRRFLELTYNRNRLHSALGYKPPAEFDRLPAVEKVPA